MTILVSHNGRYGDLLWALPSIRAISRHFNEPVHLIIPGEFASIAPLLQQQDYVATVFADGTWSASERTPPAREQPVFDRTYHLGYARWPEITLPFETAKWTLAQQWNHDDGPMVAIDLDAPWIQAETLSDFPYCVACGFTEAWFELKLGLLASVDVQSPRYGFTQLTPENSRWTTEAPDDRFEVVPCDWVTARNHIAAAALFFGDCSALHVLAVALGKPVLLCEPMEARWNPIFYPFGMDGRVRVVKGNDGRPTFDARACAAAIREVLARG